MQQVRLQHARTLSALLCNQGAVEAESAGHAGALPEAANLGLALQVQQRHELPSMAVPVACSDDMIIGVG
eukprot:8150519-Lingulodinium_polyedra.AAC.1